MRSSKSVFVYQGYKAEEDQLEYGDASPIKEQGHTTFITAELTSTTTKRPSKENFCQQPEFFTEDDNNGYLSTMAQRLTLLSRFKEWLDWKNIKVMPWSARSPDLNPIENIWAWIDKRLVKESIASVAQLQQAFEKLWKEFPRELCIRIVEYMPRRVRACVKVRGAHTKY